MTYKLGLPWLALDSFGQPKMSLFAAFPSYLAFLGLLWAAKNDGVCCDPLFSGFPWLALASKK